MTFPLTAPDLVCDLDLDISALETTSDLQNLVQDVTHLLLEDLGSNPDDPHRGVGIFRYLSGTQVDLVKMSGVAQSQLLQDSRIQTAQVTVRQNAAGVYPWTVIVEIGVDGSVLTLSYGYALSTGLALQAVNGP